MQKNRHIKTIPEKYGICDIELEATKYFKDHYNRDNYDAEKMFEGIPYIGYMRIDTNDPLLQHWGYSDDDIINAKILSVSETDVRFCYYDSHHDRLAWATKKHENFHVEGNVLRKAND